MFDILPETIFGLPAMAFIGLVLGIIVAFYEATFTRFRKVALKFEAEGETIVFDNRYIVTSIFGVLVVLITVEGLMETGVASSIPNSFVGLAMAFTLGFTEGWAVIRVFNERLDLYIKKKMTELGRTEQEAQSLADSVEFVEIGEKKSEKSTKSGFDEL